MGFPVPSTCGIRFPVPFTCGMGFPVPFTSGIGYKPIFLKKTKKIEIKKD
jgi:hypothetical protein